MWRFYCFIKKFHCCYKIVVFSSSILTSDDKEVWLLIQRCAECWYFRKGSGSSFSTTCSVCFSIKIFFILKFDQFSLWLLLLAVFTGSILIFFIRLVMSWILKFASAILSSRSPTWPKLQNINWKISRRKKPFQEKLKAVFIIFKGLSVARNCP